MGLKYNFFMIKTESKKLLESLVNSGLVDETDLMNRAREWGNKRTEEIEKLRGDKSPAEKKIEKLGEILKSKPEDKELRKYQERQNSPAINEISLWWMTLPKTKYLFGGYTSAPFLKNEFDAISGGIMFKAGISEFMFVSYHHGSNEGDVILISNKGKLKATPFKPLPTESERYQKYAKRIGRKTGYPILAMHNYLNEHGYMPLSWEHQATLFPKNKQKVKSKRK